MTTATTPAWTAREPALLGQTVLLIGGSAGIGLETARLPLNAWMEITVTPLEPHPNDPVHIEDEVVTAS